MLITKLEMQHRPPHRVNLFIDGEFAFSLHADLMALYGLRTGEQVGEALLDELRSREQFYLARDSAMRLLGYRLRSEKELRLRLLEKEFDPETVEQVMHMLSGAGI